MKARTSISAPLLKSFLFAGFCLLAFGSLQAQVPQLINYQGRIAVGGTNFDGTGQFKFALVDTDGSFTYWSNDGTSSGGNPPAGAVSLTVSRGLYSLLLGDATLPNMTAVPSGIFTNAAVWLRVWFNDGATGFQLLTPDQRIAAVGYALMTANVPDALITTAKLADSAVTSAKLASNAVNSAQISNGAVGPIHLAAGAVGPGQLALNAVTAANVADGAVTTTKLADGSVTSSKLSGLGASAGQVLKYNGAQWAFATDNDTTYSAGSGLSLAGTTFAVADGGVGTPKLADGSVTTAKLASGSVGAPQLAAGSAVANLQASGQAGIAGGGMILSQQLNATNLINAGYLNIGRVLTSEAWDVGSLVNAPNGRVPASVAVWTGNDMIVWGGYNFTGTLRTGARYNPLANTWTALPTNGAPAARSYHAAVWTGTEMIIWGGSSNSVYLNTGGRYNPIANTWTPTSTNGAPSARDEMWDAVWTGSEMLVWGGWDGTNPVNTGGRYNPSTDTWTPITTNGAPASRYDHAAIWTGTELIIWGGFDGTSPVNTGARYNPAFNTWTPVATSNAPAARWLHASVWTGNQMIIWGGRAGTTPSADVNTGGRYDPLSDTWMDVSATDAPTAREDYPLHAIWTGNEMVVWGGTAISSPQNTGGRYDPLSNTWKAMAGIGAPNARLSMAVVWTGQSMILFGGTEFVNYLGGTFLYTPSRGLYLYQKP